MEGNHREAFVYLFSGNTFYWVQIKWENSTVMTIKKIRDLSIEKMIKDNVKFNFNQKLYLLRVNDSQQNLSPCIFDDEIIPFSSQSLEYILININEEIRQRIINERLLSKIRDKNYQSFSPEPNLNDPTLKATDTSPTTNTSTKNTSTTNTSTTNTSTENSSTFNKEPSNTDKINHKRFRAPKDTYREKLSCHLEWGQFFEERGYFRDALLFYAPSFHCEEHFLRLLGKLKCWNTLIDKTELLQSYHNLENIYLATLSQLDRFDELISYCESKKVKTKNIHHYIRALKFSNRDDEALNLLFKYLPSDPSPALINEMIYYYRRKGDERSLTNAIKLCLSYPGFIKHLATIIKAKAILK